MLGLQGLDAEIPFAKTVFDAGHEPVRFVSRRSCELEMVGKTRGKWKDACLCVKFGRWFGLSKNQRVSKGDILIYFI